MLNGNNSFYQNMYTSIQNGEGEFLMDTNAPNLATKDITENGTYNASADKVDGYSKVIAEVNNSYTSADEGKVVDNGELVAQTAMAEEVTENGTINTTLYNSVTVNVSSGGGGSSGNDVIFYDYDGSVVASYSAADFANLSAMPANPTHTGLTSQGWNWSLADAKTYVANYGKLNIGQMYITSDGKTKLYYVISKNSLTLDLYLTLDEDTELDIDWGDDSAHTTWTYDDGDSSKSHEYSDGGRYIVAITVVSGGFSGQTSGEESTLKKVEFGSGVTSIANNAFSYCYGLTSITIPSGVTIIESGAFYYCQALSSITIPNSVESIGDNAFDDCLALTSITIPNRVESIGYYAFNCCTSLTSVTIPSSVESIGEQAFYECNALSSVTIPNSVTYIGGSVFDICYALTSVTFEPITPPELSGDLELPTTCIIRVPQGSLSAYTSAENYPDPSEYIYEEY